MPKNKLYVLTETAAQDFRGAKRWSLARWSNELTKQYFTDLHKGADYIATHLNSVQKRDDLTGDTGLCIHAVREHYIVYVPTGVTEIIIVALIRQNQNVLRALKANSFKIHRSLKEIYSSQKH
ncbi:MAG: type II toxin-antitoxin system RelE/ParE family toxin [Kordiimonadaceae bacterium]|nr:type II toxin-antitoxin system RelE/ParE family toxin [Kordiimonadaceae bacterium]